MAQGNFICIYIHDCRVSLTRSVTPVTVSPYCRPLGRGYTHTHTSGLTCHHPSQRPRHVAVVRSPVVRLLAGEESSSTADTLDDIVIVIIPPVRHCIFIGVPSPPPCPPGPPQLALPDGRPGPEPAEKGHRRHAPRPAPQARAHHRPHGARLPVGARRRPRGHGRDPRRRQPGHGGARDGGHERGAARGDAAALPERGAGNKVRLYCEFPPCPLSQFCEAEANVCVL